MILDRTKVYQDADGDFWWFHRIDGRWCCSLSPNVFWPAQVIEDNYREGRIVELTTSNDGLVRENDRLGREVKNLENLADEQSLEIDRLRGLLYERDDVLSDYRNKLAWANERIDDLEEVKFAHSQADVDRAEKAAADLIQERLLVAQLEETLKVYMDRETL